MTSLCTRQTLAGFCRTCKRSNIYFLRLFFNFTTLCTSVIFFQSDSRKLETLEQINNSAYSLNKNQLEISGADSSIQWLQDFHTECLTAKAWGGGDQCTKTCFCQWVRLSCFGELPDVVWPKIAQKSQKNRKWPILVLPEVDFTKIAKSSLFYC